MSNLHHDVQVFINHSRFGFDQHEQTGGAIKRHTGIPADHSLCLDALVDDAHEQCGCDRKHSDELKVIADGDKVMLKNGLHFWSVVPASHVISVIINLKPFEFADAHQTGRSLKERAGILLTDVLFRDRPKEDEVIADDTKVVLECGDCFHSAPPADYGAPRIGVGDVGFERFDSVPQPDGWTFLVVHDYPLPPGLAPAAVDLLVKLPPAFPDAAPDMFWLSPHIRTPSGVEPQGTSVETVLGGAWQRFSWHLKPGAWRPGMSTLRDYMRCVRTRLEKRN